MSQYVHRINLAANVGLDRRDCRTCKQETLHRNFVCIHCGETQSIDQGMSRKPNWHSSIRHQMDEARNKVNRKRSARLGP